MPTSTQTHTPGPWHIGMKPGPMVYGPSGEQVADCRMEYGPNENRHNARLIAAAPALLAALEQLDTAYETGGEGDFAAAKAAIAAARGEG